MRIIKTSEKILVWMHRTGITGQQIANEIGITRQAWSNKLRSNVFTTKDIITIKRLGFIDE
jgi:transcriptional regulator with XRE-family HTH domain